MQDVYKKCCIVRTKNSQRIFKHSDLVVRTKPQCENRGPKSCAPWLERHVAQTHTACTVEWTGRYFTRQLARDSPAAAALVTSGCKSCWRPGALRESVRSWPDRVCSCACVRACLANAHCWDTVGSACHPVTLFLQSRLYYVGYREFYWP